MMTNVMHSSDSLPYEPFNVFRRQQSIQGGPVTCATIRFPPQTTDERSANDDVSQEEHYTLKSKERVVLSRGGWIESHPLCTSDRDGACEDDTGVYKTLAFGNSSDEVSFEAVSGMIYPSSSASLSYAAAKNRKMLSSKISVVAYGGRRLSFLTGGGLSTNENVTSRDNFAHIPIITSSTCALYLEVSDWIHDTSLLDLDWNCSLGKRHVEDKTSNAFLLALGMVNNNVEIWGFRPTAIKNNQHKEQMALEATKLQCISCEVRCMTYSLSFHGWNDDDVIQSTSDLPCLIAASGTVFGEIVVWGVVDRALNENRLNKAVGRWLLHENVADTPDFRLKVAPSFRLKGHHGSVFSAKFGPSGEIASTSDDRTVRLWTLVPSSSDGPKYDAVITASDILESQSTHSYTLAWTGWGHTARVWDVSFAPCQSVDSTILVSAGEDGVARIWSPHMTEKEFRSPLRGHRCESIWTINVCEGIAVTGGNDGSVKLFDLESHVAVDGAKTSSVPLSDPLPESNGNTKLDLEDTTVATKKKKRKKTKSKSQMIGMQFYRNDALQNNLLVASRDGSLVSFDIAQETWTVLNSWCDKVTSYSIDAPIDVDPTTGTCIAVHPSGKSVVVGTSDGLLISSSISDSIVGSKVLTFNMTSHLSIQSMKWLDKDRLLAFCTRGTITCHEFQDNLPKAMHLVKLETTGIPLSCTFDHNAQILYTGDSRGNLTSFNLHPTLGAPCSSNNEELTERRPDSILARVHAKEHINDIVVSNNGAIFSVGNDGCITQCRRDESGQLHKVFSVPVANVTGLRDIWLSDAGGFIVGGYYGNDYVGLDVTSGYEHIRVSTGGRQRRQELMIDTSNGEKFNTALPSSYVMAICTGEKSIETHSRGILERKCSRYISSVGHTLHAEPINRLCWIPCSKKSECKYLLSGSNDCTVKLSKFQCNRLVSVKDLPPHESCVRGVCSSTHPESHSSLLVSCGGKLSVEFYLLHHESCRDDDPVDVAFLCSYRTLGSASIDHRMNAVKAIPLLKSSPISHLVAAADSDGNMHIVIVTEQAPPRQTTIGNIIQGNGRPILCLELVSYLGERILALVGNTAGEVAVWDLPCCVDGDENSSDKSPSRLLSLDAHSSGVNDLSVAIVNQCDSEVELVLCSVGDDQTLAVHSLCVACNDSAIGISRSRLNHREIYASPLKAVKVTYDHALPFGLIYTTGQDEFVSLWQLKFEPISVKYLSSSSIGTEGSCIDCIITKDSTGDEQELIAVGGEGIEVQSIGYSAMKAAKRLEDANYLLITAGAGFSADSGLSTYECAPSEYKELCDPSQLMVDPSRFQRFWLNFTSSYRQTKPHTGYDIIDRWCSGGVLPNLARNNDSLSPWWVYTSNVDGHFSRFNSFEGRVCEIHGCADEYLCPCRIGYSNGEPRLGKDWDDWNQKTVDCCQQPKVRVPDDSMDLLTCNKCHLPLRPNVLMFNDTDENVLKDIAIQRELYQAWESQVEDSISQQKSKLVVLELGCGINVPAVRQESEEVLSDCTQIIETQDGGKGSVCLIRINPKNSEVNELGRRCDSISIQGNAKAALEEIDFWLQQM